MKRTFLAFACCFIVSSFCSLWALDLSISVEDQKVREPLCQWVFMLPVWSEQNGPCPLGEIIFPEKKGYYSAYVAFDSASDDGNWIDKAFSSEGVFNVSSGVDLSSAGNVIPESGEEIISRHITDSLEKLSFFSYGEEAMSCTSKEDGKVLVYNDSKRIVRKTFDGSVRLVKKEEWHKGNMALGKPVIVQSFSYGEGNKPVSSELINGEEKHLISYNENGKAVVSENYKLYKRTEKSKGRYYKESVTEWSYNSKGRIITKSSLFFEFNKIYTEVKGTNSRKEVYEYKLNDSCPDYFYYENDILRLSTVYSAEGSYITTMSFDDGFVVESIYEDNKRKKDIYYLNGNVRRTKVYE